MHIESFVTTLIDWTFVLMTPTKWAFVRWCVLILLVVGSEVTCGELMWWFATQSYIQTFTKYCTCHEKWHLNFHQILRLPRSKTHILSPHHIWNVIYSARSNRCHHPTSQIAPCHEKWLDCFIVLTYETSFPMRGATGVTIPPHQYCACHAERLTYLIIITYETSFTLRGATCVTIPTSPNTAPATKNDWTALSS